MAMDLREKAAYERAAYEGDVRLKALVEHVSDIIALVDADGVTRFVTPATQAILGYVPAEVTGRRFFEFVHPDDLAHASSEFAAVLGKPRQPHTSEIRFLHKQGGTRILECTSVNLFSDPSVQGIVVTCSDVTESRDAESRTHQALEEAIEAIAATLEARDPYTAGHQHRVAGLAVAIGRELGLSTHRLQGLLLAATIHDIGKVKIPAEILSMPRRLTAVEYELVKSHPQAGYDILKGVHFPWPIAEIVLQHHEQIDGSGYPRGLKGDEILLEAKIVAVADTVEAMNSHRPYRAGLGVKKALDEIARKSGSSYDPAVVDACIKVFQEEGFSF